MASLPTCFKTALSNIEPGDDATNAKRAHERVTEALQADDRCRRLGVSSVLIGSYARDVSIRRVKDVDVFVRLTKADEDLRPGDILDHLQAVLERSFGKERVERQHRSIKVEFPDYDLSVDVVPARPCGEHWEIPEKTDGEQRASWVETNPTKMTELKEEANAEFLLNGAGVYVPVVKLVRQIRREWVEDHPGGYYFEVLTYWSFQQAKPREDSVAAYLTVILEELVGVLDAAVDDGLDDPTLQGREIATRASTAQLRAAAARMGEAAQLARAALDETDKCRAAVQWRKLLGSTKHTKTADDVFPLPSYCNADGTTKTEGAVTQGSPAVPAGSDRYA